MYGNPDLVLAQLCKHLGVCPNSNHKRQSVPIGVVTRHNARCYVRIVTSAWLPRARPARIAHQARSPRPRGLACGLACVIALLIPADTSKCERIFSLMNDLKKSERSRINQSTSRTP